MLHGPRNRSELYDADYLETLSEEDFQFYKKFMKEWANADLDFKDLSKNMHNTPELKKDCTDRNNKRNADLYVAKKYTNYLVDISELKDSDECKNFRLTEEALITNIDESIELESILKDLSDKENK